MALVEYGAIVTKISGKLGGHYFTQSLSGAVISTNPKQPRNPYTRAATSGNTTGSNRSTISSILIYVVRQWKNVSASNKLAWAAAAPYTPLFNKLGVAEKPSAYHFFVHVNYQRISNGQSLYAAPPAFPAQPVPIAITLVPAHTTTLQINLASAIPTGYIGYVSATPALSGGRKPSSELYAFIVQLAAGTSGTVDVISNYVARYGAPTLGNVVWVSLKLYSVTGLKGQPYIASSVIS